MWTHAVEHEASSCSPGLLPGDKDEDLQLLDGSPVGLVLASSLVYTRRSHKPGSLNAEPGSSDLEPSRTPHNPLPTYPTDAGPDGMEELPTSKSRLNPVTLSMTSTFQVMGQQ